MDGNAFHFAADAGGLALARVPSSSIEAHVVGRRPKWVGGGTGLYTPNAFHFEAAAGRLARVDRWWRPSPTTACPEHSINAYCTGVKGIPLTPVQ